MVIGTNDNTSRWIPLLPPDPGPGRRLKPVPRPKSPPLMSLPRPKPGRRGK